MGPRVPCDAGTCFRNQGTNWEAQGYQWEIKVELIQGTEGSKAPGAVSKALGTEIILGLRGRRVPGPAVGMRLGVRHGDGGGSRGTIKPGLGSKASAASAGQGAVDRE